MSSPFIQPPRGPYDRLELARPPHLPNQQWAAIEVEAARVQGALSRGDFPQAVGSLKDLVEAVARCTHELNGTPAAPNSGFGTVVSGAHELLRTQPGPGLTHDQRHAQIARSALKMTEQLASIRNDFGTGHGRAAPVEVSLDEITLVIDGSLTWVRWALRRLGQFCIGRPQQIIDQLENGIWSRHLLRERLEAVDLSQPHVASQVGLAVGRRASRDTLCVLEDGVETPAASDDVVRWPPAYRIAAANGLLSTSAGVSTVSATRLRLAAELLRPIGDSDLAAPPVAELFESLQQRIGTFPWPPGADDEATAELTETLQQISRQDHYLAESARQALMNWAF